MALYKGVEIDDALVDLVRRMGTVAECQDNLQTLQSVWDNLTLLGHLSGTGADMTDTRRAFHQLTGGLLNQLGRETLKKSVLAMKSKAQVAVDIMIRNLFERTADIGFLAMDDDVRDYLTRSVPLRAAAGEDVAARTQLAAMDAALARRFREYARKYSVYFNIILLDPAGNVLVQLDADNPVRHSSDPLIQASLATDQAYVETFRASDLLPGQASGLIYSYRVAAPEGVASLGVLCLCFRFANEAEGIFANLVGPQDWSVATLLDRDGRVIASSDPYHVPVGAPLALVLDRDWRVVRFAGREYLATTRPTQGYQGYMGPGWYGHVMLPLDHAFDQETAHTLENIPAGVLEAVMSNPLLFSEALRDIPCQAAKIQRSLNRSVWNGNVRQSGERKALNPAFSKVLLWEISNTGLKTQDVFERSIADLHQTVVSAILQDSQFQAALAIDIMDRNLYERANDCRWWALASAFRNALAGAEVSAEGQHAVSETLVQINGLYTVYDNLVVYDRQGRVVAVSNPDYRDWCGRSLNEDWVRQSLQLRDSQSYTVSRFAASPLYQGRHTYVYAAAIHAPGESQEVVGGIGIVFDAQPQFAAMLADALPRDERGEVPTGCFGVFADRERHVIASTRAELAPGTPLDLEDGFFRLANGEGMSSIAVFAGHYYAVGARMSQGYREYKGGDDAYHNDVVALVFVPLGERNDERRQDAGARARLGCANGKGGGKGGGNGEGLEIATFHVDSHWLGVPSEHVVEAIDARNITSVPGSADNMHGYLMFRGNVIPVVGLWGMLGKADRRHASATPQIVVLRLGQDDSDYLGVLVDELGEIPEISMERIERISPMLAGENVLAESLVKPEQGGPQGEMLVLISPERLFRRFLVPNQGESVTA